MPFTSFERLPYHGLGPVKRLLDGFHPAAYDQPQIYRCTIYTDGPYRCSGSEDSIASGKTLGWRLAASDGWGAEGYGDNGNISYHARDTNYRSAYSRGTRKEQKDSLVSQLPISRRLFRTRLSPTPSYRNSSTPVLAPYADSAVFFPAPAKRRSSAISLPRFMRRVRSSTPTFRGSANVFTSGVIRIARQAEI